MDNVQLTAEERVARANRVTWLSVWVNTVLTIAKFVAGLLGRSSAMVADAAHSASDFATDFAVLIGMRLAGKPQDCDHPYGHGKYETLAAAVVGVALCGVGLAIAFHGAAALWAALVHGAFPARPGMVAFWAGVVSIVVKEWLYQATVRVARQTDNDALLANAWHHRSDALSSIATTVGVGAGALFGGKWALLDPLAAMGVGLVLLKIAWDIVKDAVDKLAEQGMSEAENARILELVHSVEGLSEPHHLRSRRVGNVAVIEMHFRVDPSMTVLEAHGIASRVEQALRGAFGADAIVTIHVEPWKEGTRQ